MLGGEGDTIDVANKMRGGRVHFVKFARLYELDYRRTDDENTKTPQILKIVRETVTLSGKSISVINVLDNGKRIRDLDID